MNNLTIKQLAAKHNELLARLIELNVETKVAPVKRFATKEAGIKRNNDLIAAIEAAEAEVAYLNAEEAKQVIADAEEVDAAPLVAYTYKFGNSFITVHAHDHDDAVEKVREQKGQQVPASKVVLTSSLPKKKAKAEPVEAPKKATKAGHCDIQPSGYRILPCRVGTKQAMLLDMLASTGGATMEELTEALGWKAVTVRSGFSWDMKNKGYGIKSEEIGDKIVYKIVVPEGEEIPPHTPRKSAK